MRAVPTLLASALVACTATQPPERGQKTPDANSRADAAPEAQEGATGGGAAVDTPGFREYALWGLEGSELAALMPDLAEHHGSCRFADCLHRTEPECAIRAAAEAGELSQRRYHSYLRILETLFDESGRSSR